MCIETNWTELGVLWLLASSSSMNFGPCCSAVGFFTPAQSLLMAKTELRCLYKQIEENWRYCALASSHSVNFGPCSNGIVFLRQQNPSCVSVVQ